MSLRLPKRRNESHPIYGKKTENLLLLEGAKERLHLFQADLLEEGSFDAVFDGCEGVFHTASPVSLSVNNPQVELLDPAVNGTLNVLRSCARVPSMKRVILTSSMAAVACNYDQKSGVVMDESWFSDPSFCEKHKLWYALSKTLAEDSAWKYAKQHGIDMVVMNPGLVLGPLLQPFVSLSLEIVLDLFSGSESYNGANTRWVDVRDVALAHILALEIPSASGRYCLVERSAHTSEAINILRRLYPDRRLPDKCTDKNLVPQTSDYTVSTEKTRSLGVEFIPLEVSLKDTVESLREKGLVNF